jgi:hypothetical protein
MRRAINNQTDAPGYDSFLDIVCNLVGILVILIMVIGVRTQDALDASAGAGGPSATANEQLPDVDAPKSAAARMQADIMDLDRQVETVQEQVQRERLHRDQLQLTLTSAQRDLSARRENLDADQRERYDLEQMLGSAQFTLAKLEEQRGAVESMNHAPQVLQHFPTPLAKTVFGREEHYRLLSGRLTHVPLSELTDRLKREAEQKVWKLRDAPQVTETVGPLEGFHLKYTLQRTSYVMQTSSGPVRREAVELAQFVLVPVSEGLGVPLDEAMQSESDFSQSIGRLDPRETTITVWTYPDSYTDFRRLKDYLRTRGFLSAARPLPHGHPIGGSPRGTKSSAQ